ncbi:putative transcriptional regulator, ArsR family [Kribbella flavida DSM 17836]|uniref:Putative transcriptional regulator, ArsR family n=1 Tax=Kribbella flavida (strain DSM 17836 / JCM 10339 / NBRC 14399) TaxID=479435 RepID=D2PRN1_KRIFD|nr:helix-turn-helix domain-containing protein [Kribbella flavida]ADB34949.1 putative transcriptional regulator, ArsR family [Kribbella flavida DSM 17836]
MSTPKQLPQPDRAEIRVDAVLQALGEPVRLLIVRALADTPEGIACGEIDLPVTASTRAHHLRTLREAGVLTTHTEGTRRISRLRREDLDTLYPGLLNGVLAAEQ